MIDFKNIIEAVCPHHYDYFVKMLNCSLQYMWIYIGIIIICLVLFVLTVKALNKITGRYEDAINKLKLRLSDIETAYTELRKDVDTIKSEKHSDSESYIIDLDKEQNDKGDGNSDSDI